MNNISRDNLLKVSTKHVTDESNREPVKIEFDDVKLANVRLEELVQKTPCTKSNMSTRLELDLFLKQEFLNQSGSYSERAARYALMRLPENTKEVITASNGNFGICLAYCARKQESRLTCTVVMPTKTPSNKITKAQKMGANVIFHGATVTESRQQALTMAQEQGIPYIDGSDDPHVIAANGTIGMEILQQVPDVSAIIVPVGRAGLLAGIAVAVKHLKPDTEIYGVETEKTCNLVESIKKREPTQIETDGTTVADDLCANSVSINAFHSMKGLVDKMIVVSEDWVSRALVHLVEQDKIIVEGGGATAVASVLAGMHPKLKEKKVVCVLTCANIDSMILDRVLEHGMAADGRLIKFKVRVRDEIGSIANLCQTITNMGIAIHNLATTRTWLKGEVFEMQIKLIVETKGWEQTKKLVEVIRNNYPASYFIDTAERPDPQQKPPRGPCLAPNPVCMQYRC